MHFLFFSQNTFFYIGACAKKSDYMARAIKVNNMQYVTVNNDLYN